jgi:hypothetical protein
MNRKGWRTVYLTAAVNLVLLIAGDVLVRAGVVPDVWALRGPGLFLLLFFALWSATFIMLVANPFGHGLRMVLSEPIHRIDYVFLLGLAVVTISYYALIFFLVLRVDPGGLTVTGGGTDWADLLYGSVLTFLSAGFDVIVPSGWAPRLAMLTELMMGLGYMAGVLALLTNRLASEPLPAPKAAAEAGGPDLTEGTAWAGGSAAGAAVGSVAGPAGTVVGAIVGGALADHAVDAARDVLSDDPDGSDTDGGAVAGEPQRPH